MGRRDQLYLCISKDNDRCNEIIRDNMTYERFRNTGHRWRQMAYRKFHLVNKRETNETVLLIQMSSNRIFDNYIKREIHPVGYAFTQKALDLSTGKGTN